MRARLLLLAGLCIGCASGCASVAGGTSQTIRVDAVDLAGGEVEDADCTLSNDRGEFRVTTPGSSTVRKSGADMRVACTHPTRPEGKASMVSRANAGMFGNLLVGGGIGAIVDHQTGSAYSYPEWIRVVMGRTLRFDRKDDVAGRPNPGVEDTGPSTARSAEPSSR